MGIYPYFYSKEELVEVSFVKTISRLETNNNIWSWIQSKLKINNSIDSKIKSKGATEVGIVSTSSVIRSENSKKKRIKKWIALNLAIFVLAFALSGQPVEARGIGHVHVPTPQNSSKIIQNVEAFPVSSSGKQLNFPRAKIYNPYNPFNRNNGPDGNNGGNCHFSNTNDNQSKKPYLFMDPQKNDGRNINKNDYSKIDKNDPVGSYYNNKNNNGFQNRTQEISQDPKDPSSYPTKTVSQNVAALKENGEQILFRENLHMNEHQMRKKIDHLYERENITKNPVKTSSNHSFSNEYYNNLKDPATGKPDYQARMAYKFDKTIVPQDDIYNYEDLSTSHFLDPSTVRREGPFGTGNGKIENAVIFMNNNTKDILVTEKIGERSISLDPVEFGNLTNTSLDSLQIQEDLKFVSEFRQSDRYFDQTWSKTKANTTIPLDLNSSSPME